MRLTIVQYGGDYRDAWERFERGGQETYQAQRYSISFVGQLARRLDQVAVVCAVTDAVFDIVLPNGVRAIGAGLKSGFRPKELIPFLAKTTPDHLTLVTPLSPLLKWARRNDVRTITTLADSFERRGLSKAIQHHRLAKELNFKNVDWVGNHGISACLSLAAIGVRPDKIIPWDWPASHKPSDYPSRTLDRSRPLKLVYVGSISEEKGVSDLLLALRRLGDVGTRPTLTLVGADVQGRMQSLTNALDLADQVRFTGVVANECVPEIMRLADVVVIPSRHEYPEGLPLTIYEALATRTPIIASDHPMFRGALTHAETALVFRAKDTRALADAIVHIGDDARLYASLSINSPYAWKALQLPVMWGGLVEKWLADTPEDRRWLSQRGLISGLYDEQIAARSAT
jgi:glycosyltransferase involved in cell wall biosynthesis